MQPRSRILCILNPTAGGGRAGRAADDLRSRVGRAFEHVDFRVTDSSEAAADLAHAATGVDLVVAAGGDGTVHGVGTAMAARGDGLPFGILPVGTGNDYAFGLGLTGDLEQALRALRTGAVRQADVGTVTIDDQPPRLFLNAVGVGFDAQASIRAIGLRRIKGFARYLVAVLDTLRTWQAPVARIVLPTEELRFPVMFVTVAKGPRSGGGFLVTPGADPFNGELCVCIAEGMGLVRALSLLPRVVKGAHTGVEGVHMRMTDAIGIGCADGLAVHADGEILATAARSINVGIASQALAVCVPEEGPAALSSHGRLERT